MSRISAPQAIPSVPKNYEYIGCYHVDLDQNFVDGPQERGFSLNTCAIACHQFQYFAIQNGGWCACSTDYGCPEEKYPLIAESNCENGGLDGDDWANAVYLNELWESPEDVVGEPDFVDDSMDSDD